MVSEVGFASGRAETRFGPTISGFLKMAGKESWLLSRLACTLQAKHAVDDRHTRLSRRARAQIPSLPASAHLDSFDRFERS